MPVRENKLYVGNLSYDVNEDELQQFFNEKGLTVQSVNIIKDKFTDRSKGFGFVEVASEEDVQRGINELNGQQLKGRTLNVSKARSREERGTSSRHERGRPRGRHRNY